MIPGGTEPFGMSDTAPRVSKEGTYIPIDNGIISDESRGAAALSLTGADARPMNRFSGEEH